MVLRLAWVTPLGPRSDVGAFSRNILAAARRDHAARVEMLPIVQGNGPEHFVEGPRLALDDRFDPDLLAAFDHPCYNLGNNAENHGRINRLALARPGVVILHDVVMHPSLAFEAFEAGRGAASYAALVAATHGAEGLAAVAESGVLSDPPRPAFLPWETSLAESLPLIAPFVASAAAVVVHSAFAAERVRPLTRAPVLTLGLPYDQKPSLTEAEIAAWEEATRRTDRPLAVAFGHIARSKCLDLVLRALALAPPSLRLLVAGRPVEPGLVAELEALAAQLGLSGRVAFETDVSVARLQEIKRAADLFLNIRHPNTEGASGSLVEMLDAGKPVVVRAAGCYADLPEGAAQAITSIADPAELAAALAALAGDPERRIAIGRAGRAVARRWSGSLYVERLLAFLSAEGTTIRRRQGVHGGRRAPSHAALASLDPADEAWARDAALARLFLGPLFARAEEPDPAPFLWLPAPLLRGLVVAGLFGREGDAGLIAAVDTLLADSDRPGAFRTVSQALALKRLAEGGPPPSALPPEALAPAALPLLAALTPAALAAGLVAFLLGRLPSRAEIAELGAALAGGERAAASAARLLDSDAAKRRGLPEQERRELVRIATGLRGTWEQGVPDAAPLSAEAPLAPGQGLEAALRGAFGEVGVDGAWSRGPSAGLALRLPPAGERPRALGIELRLAGSLGASARLCLYAAGRRLAAPLLPTGRPQRLELTLPAGCRPEEGVMLLLDAGPGAPEGPAIEIRSVALLGEGEPSPPPRLPAGRRIAFTPNDPLAAALLAGPWYGLEPGGVWSRGPVGRLRARLPEDAASLLLELRAEGMAAQGEKRLAVRGNGALLAEALLPDASLRRVTVPLAGLPREPDGRLLLDLDCGKAANLAELGLGRDTRELGVMLVALTVLPEERA
jgi:glycosyltransferase involved in cell wall biosynthesis